jgi:hypothetical protein
MLATQNAMRLATMVGLVIEHMDHQQPGGTLYLFAQRAGKPR